MERWKEGNILLFLFFLHSYFTYPCRCLCLGFDGHTIYTYPLRRTTLHFEQIFFTDAFTRIGLSLFYVFLLHPSRDPGFSTIRIKF